MKQLMIVKQVNKIIKLLLDLLRTTAVVIPPSFACFFPVTSNGHLVILFKAHVCRQSWPAPETALAQGHIGD